MRPYAVIFAAALLASCSQPASEATKEPPKQYKLHGEVTRLDAQNKVATIDAQKINGWMEAMKMDYPVKDQQDLSKLHPGDCIDATVFVQGNDFWVMDVRSTTAAPGTCLPAKTPPDGK
ncbi:MAG: copper-binding protein [Bryobacterales bacterium]|nr:copper-binding protein [Bryobacterales bacterium]MBV9398624.1 copper-binding protein [Bryobacterales bacterium]